uniref:Protein roadkill n=1 Tax=Culex pipiens TaxID=7175 RepID=A0A8D8J1I3_CULPI
MSSTTAKRVRVCNDSCVTFTETKEFNFTWTIQNFPTWMAKSDNERYSPRFPATEEEDLQWALLFKCESSSDASYCSLYLKLKLKLLPEKNIDAMYEFVMMDSEKTIFMKRSGVDNFGTGTSWGYSNFIKRDELENQIGLGNTLIIACKVNVNAGMVDEMIESSIVEPEASPSSLIEDLASLLESKKYGDVSIKVGNRKILAHKNILAARSSVFAAMFEHKMQEKITNVVSIGDIKLVVLEEMLRYIYTDKVNNLDTLSYQLYTAADKYDIPALKSLCRIAILGNLSTENVAETIICADLHSDGEMKSRALQFLSRNSSVALGVTKSKGWKQMEATHPHLVTEAFEALASNM